MRIYYVITFSALAFNAGTTASRAAVSPGTSEAINAHEACPAVDGKTYQLYKEARNSIRQVAENPPPNLEIRYEGDGHEELANARAKVSVAEKAERLRRKRELNRLRVAKHRAIKAKKAE